jgi:endonuclease/exonuclease/phosphatase family metal-dependent hydrolase
VKHSRRKRPLPRLAAWLCLILVVSSQAPAQSPSRPPAQIKIATWNLDWLSRRSHEGNTPRSDADYARLARYARRLDADIVALQEVDGEAAARRVFDPSLYAFHFTRDENNPQRAGFAVKKLLPLRPFPDVPALDMEGTRRGADIGLKLDGGELRLLSIHLKTGCWEESLETATEPCRILRRQLPALEAWVDERARAGGPFAVLGDFNRRLGPGDEYWAGLNDGDPPEAGLTDAMAGYVSGCWGGEYPHYIDHIVLSRHAAGWLVPGSLRQLVFDPEDARFREVLSDHCPVMVTLSPFRQEVPPPVAQTPSKLRADEAARHAGETATVCGNVASARYLATSRRQPTFLNLEKPYPDQALTVVIWGSDRPAFGNPEVTFLHKRICVTGKIEIYQGRPEMVATSPEQIATVSGK